MSDVLNILNTIGAGNSAAADQLLPLVYDELRRLAAAKLAHEQPGQTLDATALVHEAYLRLVGAQQFDNRGHFFASAAEAMRRILVDRARQRNSLKRGGDLNRVPLHDFADSDADEQILHLDEALSRLAEIDPEAARVVELHHFAGLSQDDVAVALGVTAYQIRQKWAFARAWLKTILADS